MISKFPFIFDENEYNPQLGVYQKWICGDKSQKVEKIFSFSAFQTYYESTGFEAVSTYQKYAEYLYLSVSAITTNMLDWYARIYIDESILNPKNPDNNIWINKIEMIKTMPRVQMICVKFPRYYLSVNCHKELLPVMFRYLALFDKTTSIILFRDIDNIYTEQHNYFITEWLSRGNDICFYMNENYKINLCKTINLGFNYINNNKRG